MISPNIKQAIVALLSTDALATDADRRRVMAALDGEARPPLTISQAAQRLNVSRWTIARFIQSGKMRRLPDGRIPEDEVFKYLTAV